MVAARFARPVALLLSTVSMSSTVSMMAHGAVLGWCLGW